MVLLGVPTNIDFLARVMENPAFLAGRVHTGSLGDEAAALRAPAADASTEAAVLAAAALAQPDFRRAAFRTPEPYGSIGAWRN
jgi:propionyl-CoA carboxylase alpha chain/3-methylcrotonyl-CoA carboxylase alpha subunit/acetyl-CoA/propionyl-CoA carboxylase biotin carboxyl carrier protein